jgi:CheY-like chemotaxis protein
MTTVAATKLLIADDDPSVVAAHLLYFTLEGFDVKTADDGPDCLLLLQSWHPQVALLDIEMPRLDGRSVVLTFLHGIQQPQILLIAVSGLTAPHEIQHSLNAGFHHHFTKPVHLPSVLLAIRSFLGGNFARGADAEGKAR